jgi:alpha-glucuronidase
MWEEFFGYVEPSRLVGIAGVANIGLDTNWCGHHFSQANWYAFGRLAWDPTLTSEQIAKEWLSQTFGNEKGKMKDEEISTVITSLLLRSREACVNYMMPLGLHHIFKFDHHMGPEPDGFKADYPIEWCPVYYHRANKDSIGVDRSSTGTNATGQYRQPYRSIYDKPETCPDEYLLWFHRLPWTYRMRSGLTLWEELQKHYNHGVAEVDDFVDIWQQAKPYIDSQRWQEVDSLLRFQQQDARLWRDTCLKYFGGVIN